MTTTSWSLAFGPQLAFELATLQDDMEFARDGTPADADGSTMPAAGSRRRFRAGRYNWAAVLQRPENSNRTVADLKILVFDGRAPASIRSTTNSPLPSTP